MAARIRHLAWFALVLALILPCGRALAQVRRLAIVDMDRTLEQAVATSLEPWSVEVVALTSPAPGNTMPASAERARLIAAEEDAGAVVWIAGAEALFSLWLYDVDTRKVVVLELPTPPPYDEPTAAGVALTIKTLLRHSVVAPEAERLAVPRAPPARPPEPPEPAPASRPVTGRAGLEVFAGTRVRGPAGHAFERRTGFGGYWLPAAGSRVLGVAATLSSGSGLAVEEPGFVGAYRDTTIALLGHVRLDLGARVSLSGGVGGALHLTALDGLPPDTATAVHLGRVNPSLESGLGVHVRVAGNLALGLGVHASVLARRQRYLVGDVAVLELPLVALDVALTLGSSL